MTLTVTIIPAYTRRDHTGAVAERVEAQPAGPVLTAAEVMAILRLYETGGRFPEATFKRYRQKYDHVLRPFQVGKCTRFPLAGVLAMLDRLQADNPRVMKEA